MSEPLKILIWPNPKLKEISKPVTDRPDPAFLNDLYHVMKKAGGVGLSAIQVGIPMRIVVLDVGQGPQYYLNPVIEKTIGDRVPMIEGCLSVPGQFETIHRFPEVVVKYQLDTMENAVTHVKGLTAHCLQHELEHLDGKIFTDHLKPADRARIMGAIMKLKKQGKLK